LLAYYSWNSSPDDRARRGDQRQDYFRLAGGRRKADGPEPRRFVALVRRMAGLSDGDLMIVRFSRSACSTVARPLSAAALSRAQIG
jgi:hypothetical protein